eukprot:scaffold108092_cov59-Attheya_sp.AAC.4
MSFILFLVSSMDFETLTLSSLQEVQGSFPVVLRSASDGLKVVFHCLKVLIDCFVVRFDFTVNFSPPYSTTLHQ